MTDLVRGDLEDIESTAAETDLPGLLLVEMDVASGGQPGIQRVVAMRKRTGAAKAPASGGAGGYPLRRPGPSL